MMREKHDFHDLIHSPISNQLALIFISFVAFGVNYAANLLLAHLFTPLQYGDLQVGIYAFCFVGSLLITGLTYTTSRFFSVYAKEKKYEIARSYTLWLRNRFIRNVLILLGIGVIFVIGMYFLIHFDVLTLAASDDHILFYFILISPFWTLLMLLSAYHRSINNVIYATITSRMLPLFSLSISYVAALMLFKDEIRTIHIIYLYATVFLLLSMASFYLLYKSTPAIKIQYLKFKNYTKEKSYDEWLATIQAIIFKQYPY